MKKLFFSTALSLVSLFTFAQKQDTAFQYVTKETKTFQVQPDQDLLLEDSMITTKITFVNANKKDTSTKMYVTFDVANGKKFIFYPDEKVGVKVSKNNDDPARKMSAYEYKGTLQDGNIQRDSYITNGFINGQLESIFIFFDDKVIQLIIHPETKKNPNNIL